MDPASPAKPVTSSNIVDVCKGDLWDTAFFTDLAYPNRQKLYDVALAAQFLQMDGLVNHCAAVVATFIRGLPTTKMRDALDPTKKHTLPSPQPEEHKA
jgi:hypothetical protein